jgi:hypothetical protein
MGTRAALRERKRHTTVVQTDDCRHHWLIESPRGALSAGRCKLCGAERQFRNSANDYIWDDDSSSSRYGGFRGVRSNTPTHDDDEMTASPSGRETALAV